jgi:DNA-binding winged helix-turn-helix (wHTH) protein
VTAGKERDRHGVALAGNRVAARLVVLPVDARWLEFGRNRFNPQTGEVRGDDGSVTLPRQPATLLRLLLEHEGEVVSREACIAHLWGQHTAVVYDDGLNFCVRQIRAALRESARSPGHLETLPRRGYRLIGPVRRVTDPPVLAPAPASGKSHTLIAAWVASLFLALVVGTFLPLIVEGVEAHLTGRTCPWNTYFHG